MIATKIQNRSFSFSYILVSFRVICLHACLIEDIKWWKRLNQKKSFRRKWLQSHSRFFFSSKLLRFRCCCCCWKVRLHQECTITCSILVDPFLLTTTTGYRKRKENTHTQTKTFTLLYPNNNHCYIFITNVTRSIQILRTHQNRY